MQQSNITADGEIASEAYSEQFTFRPGAAAHLKSRGLQIASSTLAAKAVDGSGPPYRLWGNRAVYAIADLDHWADERLGAKIASTAERSRSS